MYGDDVHDENDSSGVPTVSRKKKTTRDDCYWQGSYGNWSCVGRDIGKNPSQRRSSTSTIRRTPEQSESDEARDWPLSSIGDGVGDDDGDDGVCGVSDAVLHGCE